MTASAGRARCFALLILTCVAAGCTSCGGGAPAAARPTFQEVRAFADIGNQVAFGPRAPGTTGHQQCLDWLIAQLTPLADRVVRQDFSASTAFGGPYPFTNLIATFNESAAGDAWMVAAHWDTRPEADEDPDPANRHKPVPGANDGGSGVAVLLEMARALKAQAPSHPVYLAFFDAEDSGKSGVDMIYSGFCIGSKQMANNWPGGLAKPQNVIVIDIVGGTAKHNDRLGNPNGSNDKFDLPEELNSVEVAPALVSNVWGTAQRLGHTAFESRLGLAMIDDHAPFIAAGYKAIDIIDFPFPEWHTIDDTVEYCSASALHQVGDTLLEVLYAK
jgi:glutaminyl-peptide cyclotransferase